MRSRLARAAAYLACALIVAACGGGPVSPAAAARSPESWIVVTPVPQTLPFDPRSVRLRRAIEALAEVAGHPIALHIDAAVVPSSRPWLEDEIIEAFESIARDLRDLREQDPVVFARAAPAIERVERRYSAAACDLSARVELNDHRVVVEGPARSHGLLARGVVARAVRREYDDNLQGTLGDVAPESVPPRDRRAYFESLVRTRPGYGWLFKGKSPPREGVSEEERLANDPHSELVLRVIAFARLVGESDPELARDVRAWLLERLRDVENESNVARAAALPEGSLRRRADAAYGAWLQASLPALDDEQKIWVARNVFPGRAACRSFDTTCRETRVVYPGFDAFAFGLSLVDEWIRGGRPLEGRGPRFDLVDSVVCPHAVDARGTRTRGRSCTSMFYREAVAYERERLAQAITRRGDDAWTTQVFANIEHSRSEDVVKLWRALEPSPASWRVATRALLSEPETHRTALEQEAFRMWKETPERRGAALALLAVTRGRLDTYYADNFWSDFAARSGAANEADVRAMLDLDARTVVHVPGIWKALAPGPWHVAVVAPALRAWLPRATDVDPAEPGRTLRALFARVCGDKDAAALGQLQATYRNVATPGSDPALANLAGTKCP